MKTLKTNISEQARNGRNGVQLVYVLEAIKNSSRATDENRTFNNDREALKFFFDTFNAEFNDTYNKRRFPNLQDRISNWLQGLPSCISIEYSCSDITKQGLIWGVIDGTDEKKTGRFINNWFSVIALRILQAAQKVGLNPYQYTI